MLPFQETRPSKPNGPICKIVKSFKTCGLNLPVDGPEDHFIHCFKEDQPCEAEARQLQSQLSVLQECVSPKGIADSDVEDADDELFILESDDNHIEILWKFRCWITWKIFFLIARSDLEGAVDELSISYYWRWWRWNRHCVSICVKSCECFLFLRLKY